MAMKRCLAAALVASTVVLFSPHAGASDETPASALQAQEARYKKIQQASRALAGRDKDWRGRTMRDDVQSYALTPSVESEVDRLRSLAQTQVKQGQTDAARETVGTLSATLDKVVHTFQGISTYWSSGAKNTADRASYLEYLRKNGVEPRHVEEIEALQRKLAQQVEGSQFAEAATQTYPELQRMFATAGQEETDALFPKIDNADFTPFLERKRTTKCPSPTKETSGNSRPKPLPTQPGKAYYPAPSKRLAEEGTSYVLVRVSAEGCAQSALIVASSGFRRLDEATLEMMMDKDYLPAAEDGQAVASKLLTKLQWKLQD